jgi:hypothetical protein
VANSLFFFIERATLPLERGSLLALASKAQAAELGAAARACLIPADAAILRVPLLELGRDKTAEALGGVDDVNLVARDGRLGEDVACAFAPGEDGAPVARRAAEDKAEQAVDAAD